MPNDAKGYAFGCIQKVLRAIIVISGYFGTFCFVNCTGFHLTGHIAIFRFRVKDILNDPYGSRRGIQKIMLPHHRLIKLADISEDCINIYVIGRQLLGTTIQLCISSYQILFVQFSNRRKSRLLIRRVSFVEFFPHELAPDDYDAYCNRLMNRISLSKWYRSRSRFVGSLSSCKEQ
ncbi:odorant receptor 13a-like [Vespula squamosa]|uniref:Odorant receptor 13a-like n=1 Tax=Vespula squamosa TaxID=30214 RepID=A0ABD2AZE7_VESSQ